MASTFRYCDLGVVPYREAWALQEALLKRVVGGSPSTLLFCEHPHVVSRGTQTKDAHILLADAEFARLGAEVIQSNRGGDVTYHGPGQVVAYPIFKMDDLQTGRDLHKFLRQIEEAIIIALSSFGVESGRNEGKTGVWVENRKIAAIGLRSSRWVTMHGLALNVTTDLDWFSRIIPCGLSEEVTSLGKILGDRCPSQQEVRAALLSSFTGVFEHEFEETLLEVLKREANLEL